MARATTQNPARRGRRGDHAVEAGGDPVGRAHAVRSADRREVADAKPPTKKNSGMTWPIQVIQPYSGEKSSRLPPIELAVVEHDDHAQPVAEGHHDHGGGPVEVDGAVAIGRGVGGDGGGGEAGGTGIGGGGGGHARQWAMTLPKSAMRGSPHCPLGDRVGDP